jgi:SAM-dependent methyltransferase
VRYVPPAWLQVAADGRNGDYYSRLRPEVIRAIPDGVGAVLDVGCGKGTLGRWLKEHGVPVVRGVELSAAAAEEARRWLDDLVVGNIEGASLPWAPASFDCIVCADVLEHTVDPWTVVGRLKSLLKPGGCIVASIPNVAHHRNLRRLLRGRWDYADEGVLDRTHLRFFTLPTIEELFARNGMAVETVDRRLDAGLRMRLLNAVLLGALGHTLNLQFIVRARVAA